MGTQLDVLLAAWTLAMRAQGFSRATIRTRRGAVGSLSHRVDPVSAHTDDVREFLADTASAWTTATYHACLRAWFRFLIEQGIRADDPMAPVKRPRRPRGVPRPVTDTDLAAVLAVATGRTHAYVMLAAYQGLRVAEIARIRGEDVTPTGLRVRGKGNRTDVLPTHPKVWTLAQDYPRRGWWFASPISRSGHITAGTVSTVLSRLFRDLDVHATAHQLRHLYVTRAYRASGQDVLTTQQLARHESPSTTAGYALVEDERMRAAILRLDDLPSPGRRGSILANLKMTGCVHGVTDGLAGRVPTP